MAKKKFSLIDKFSHQATRWIGTTQCLLVHGIIFIVAFAFVPFIGFDKVLLFTTTLLSWEAIFIGIFIQMAVNRQGKHIEDVKDDIEDIQEDIEDLQEEDIAE